MNYCILLAGGIGTRASTNIPKQFIEVNSKPVFTYCLERLDSSDLIDGIIIVCLEDWHEFILDWIEKLEFKKVKAIVSQGLTRQHSILNGLVGAKKYIGKDDKVLIHDAARPLLNPLVIEKLITSAEKNKAVIPVIETKDAIYVGESDQYVNRILPRKHMYHGQTPVCIDFMTYYNINISATEENLAKATGTCTLLFQNGIKVAVVPGDEQTFKITTNEDLQHFIKLEIEYYGN